jgi:hypothetical protein
VRQLPPPFPRLVSTRLAGVWRAPFAATIGGVRCGRGAPIASLHPRNTRCTLCAMYRRTATSRMRAIAPHTANILDTTPECNPRPPAAQAARGFALLSPAPPFARPRAAGPVDQRTPFGARDPRLPHSSVTPSTRPTSAARAAVVLFAGAVLFLYSVLVRHHHLLPSPLGGASGRIPKTAPSICSSRSLQRAPRSPPPRPSWPSSAPPHPPLKTCTWDAPRIRRAPPGAFTEPSTAIPHRARHVHRLLYLPLRARCRCASPPA